MTVRCYCLLSRLPFFELHFFVLYSILEEERLYRLESVTNSHALQILREYSRLDVSLPMQNVLDYIILFLLLRLRVLLGSEPWRDNHIYSPWWSTWFMLIQPTTSSWRATMEATIHQWLLWDSSDSDWQLWSSGWNSSSRLPRDFRVQWVLHFKSRLWRK